MFMFMLDMFMIETNLCKCFINVVDLDKCNSPCPPCPALIPELWLDWYVNPTCATQMLNRTTIGRRWQDRTVKPHDLTASWSWRSKVYWSNLSRLKEKNDQIQGHCSALFGFMCLLRKARSGVWSKSLWRKGRFSDEMNQMDNFLFWSDLKEARYKSEHKPVNKICSVARSLFSFVSSKCWKLPYFFSCKKELFHIN